jgi:uncharacterized cysteine cluster protein YcgN (CxxCxxCC family)
VIGRAESLENGNDEKIYFKIACDVSMEKIIAANSDLQKRVSTLESTKTIDVTFLDLFVAGTSNVSTIQWLKDQSPGEYNVVNKHKFHFKHLLINSEETVIKKINSLHFLSDKV